MCMQAVKTYTHCLKDIDEGRLSKWASLSPPEFSRYYWGLPEDATMRDLIMAVSFFPKMLQTSHNLFKSSSSSSSRNRTLDKPY